jgi:DNA (cytosine-5)-methyltransferase 1
MTLYLFRHNPRGQCKEIKRISLDDNPCPTIMAGGVWGDNTSHYWLALTGNDGMKRQNDGKPPYRVPSMAEISALPRNGLTVVSTFTGAGGSCLGFRMAGFKTLWASEFVPAAQQVYRLNHPGVPLDARDVRKVTPDEILAAIGKERGEVDVLEGSPPCASFSTAGQREAGWGQVRKYSDTQQRVDDLFFEFARLLNGLQPRVFVAENVSGLVKGKAKGYFKLILRELKDCGYRVSARLLGAQWLGVPQARQRVIFVGVREDLGLDPVHPAPLCYRYSVREAIPWIAAHGTAPPNAKFAASGRDVDKTLVDSGKHPAPTVIQSGPLSGSGYCVARAVEDTGGQWGAGDVTDRPAPTVRQSGPEQLYVETEADISGCAIGQEWERLEPGEKGRYLNLVKPRPDAPCPTVTQAGGNPTAASVTHPTERRKFSIAELKRICAFPDDFVLTGSYSQQWERLGRAVPPVMMFHVARVLRDEVLFALDGKTPWPHDPPCLVAGLDYVPQERRA